MAECTFQSSVCSAGLSESLLLPLSISPIAKEKIMSLSTYQARPSAIKNNEVIFVKCFELLGTKKGRASEAESIRSWEHLPIELPNNGREVRILRNEFQGLALL